MGKGAFLRAQNQALTKLGKWNKRGVFCFFVFNVASEVPGKEFCMLEALSIC